ncbi:MAG: M23 family metallopeptidase [Bacteroidales bacterium]|nr:M23 family metallopeptidase [Bacteroidales bacterium]
MKKEVLVSVILNLLIFCQYQVSVMGQDPVGPTPNSLVKPVDIPIFLAGNFGESRVNHFHSGIDIKTNGVTGIPVRSVADGYIARIKVEPGGYGHALYIRHPNGYTSLYGHLQSFSEAINAYVKSEQYRRESFSVDLFPDGSKFPVKQGQVIALSGNSGSSGGPHLHFELRETQSENPVNPLVRSMVVKDDIPPVISKLYVYSLQDRHDFINPVTVQLAKSNGTYTPSAATPVSFDEISGIGIETYDQLNGSDNHCGVYKIQGYLEGNLFFESSLDEFSFAETRYMNSFMDYRKYMTNHNYILKLFIDPNNHASIYHNTKNRGYIGLNDGNIHKIKIVVTDVSGNQSVAMMNVRRDPARFRHNPNDLPAYQAHFSYKEANSFQSDGISITLPAGALYDDLYFTYKVSKPLPGSYSLLHQIHDENVPLHVYYRLAIEATHIPEYLKSKATIAQYLGNKEYNCLGGTWEGNRMVTRTRNFGAFCILADTTKPVITPMNFSTGTDLKTLKCIRFTIKDDLSGIQSYRGEIDGKWVMFEYDSKSSQLEYWYDSKRIGTGSQHKLVLQVTDQMSNTARYSLLFTR